MWQPGGNLGGLAAVAAGFAEPTGFGGAEAQVAESQYGGTHLQPESLYEDGGSQSHNVDDETQEVGEATLLKRAAARAIAPGCEQWNVKDSSWSGVKPDRAALDFEIMR